MEAETDGTYEALEPVAAETVGGGAGVSLHLLREFYTDKCFSSVADASIAR